MSSVYFKNGIGPVEEIAAQDFVPDEIPEQLKDDCLVQYYRCRYDDRESLLEGMNDDQKKRIERELERIEKLRSTYAERAENKEEIEKFEYLKSIWTNKAITDSLENFNKIEERLEKVNEMEEDERLRRRRLEQRILANVSEWPRVPVPLNPSSKKEKEPKLARRTFKEFVTGVFSREGKEQKPKKDRPKSRKLHPKPARARPDDSYGISISKITLRKNEDPDFPSSYMKYDIERYPLNDILFKEEENPLSKPCESGTIRYFHFPANNMHWIEEAIGRYYKEKTPGEYNWRKHPNYLEKSSDLLCREHWSSLQHGGKYDPIHARHMRANCSLIMPGNFCATQLADGKKNFVIYMPYLHWETHKRRKQMAEITREVTAKHIDESPHYTESSRDEMLKVGEQVTNAVKTQHMRALTDALPPQEYEITVCLREKKLSSLGQYLLQTAKLYDALDIEPDVRLLRDHLYQDPPLHSRRTLDQSYYWKLPNTNRRDEDQVVYRATREGKDILRSTRVVMVDQLWLYVLDDNTVISCFPRRWGRNKPDYSGVHKGIRATLDHLRVGQVQSAYDLALLIMNQCSTVFFDRTKPVDERPEVLDIFSNALSNISGMKTVAFETFWRHLDKLTSNDRQLEDGEDTSRKYLNINPEGKLLKEVHDIIEELRMMARIYGYQQRVMKDFEEHLRNLHEQERKSLLKMPPSNGMLEVMVEIKNLLREKKEYETKEESKFQNGSATLHTTEVQNGVPPKLESAMTPSISIPDSTLNLAKKVMNNISVRSAELQDLEGSTVSIAEQLKDLLSLKQQQASIIEARYSLKRANESVTQGRSIMLFTIITIIFLPLSFMTSVFGMNASDFDSPSGGSSMSLRDQFKLLFPISIGIIIISILLAFSTWIRSLISFAVAVSWAAFIEYTYLRHFLLWCVQKKNPNEVYAAQERIKKRIYLRREREWLSIQKARAGYLEKDDMNEKEGEMGMEMRKGDLSVNEEEDDETGCFEGFKFKIGNGSPV